MEYISSNDYYELSLESDFSNIDFDVMINLYQPIIGYKSLSIYLTMVQFAKNGDGDDIESHESLFNFMQITPGDFNTFKNTLEAVGLIKTYYKEENGVRYFLYRLYSPKSPKEFFSDVLFKGLFIKYLGEKESKKIVEKYRKNDADLNNFSDISTSFTDVFDLDYNDRAFATKISSNIVGRNVGDVSTSFDYNIFFDNLLNISQIAKDSLNKEELNEIERIATLYGIDESTMADIIANSYDPQNPRHIDFSHVGELSRQESRYSFLTKKPSSSKSDVKGDSILASKIKLMDNVSPADYLRIKQKNTRPAISDLKLIDDLSKNFSLSNGVINALVDFVLVKQNNKLPRAYTEKIAAQLARDGVENAIDTMNCLVKNSRQKNYYKKENYQNKIINKEIEPKKEEISDADFQKALDIINKGGNN